MRYLILTITIVLLIPVLKTSAQTAKPLQGGLEIDILPYATGGYFGAGWLGKNKWRARVLKAYVKKPDFTTKKGFANHEIHASAFVIDHFFENKWKGFWMGAGFVFWNSNIQTDAVLQKANFKNYLLNGSAGYNFPFSKKLYFSPWAGLSIRTGGDKNIAVDNKLYTLPFLNPELSLKMGWFFNLR